MAAVPYPTRGEQNWDTPLKEYLDDQAGQVRVTPFVVTSSLYGADPTGVADSAAAIQSAIADAQAVGGVVYLPAGTYLLNTPLVVTSTVRLQGTAATLRLGSGFVRGTQGQGHIFVNGANDVVIDGLRFDGNKAVVAPDATNNFAVWIATAAKVTIRNCYAANVNGAGANVNAAFVASGASDFGNFIGNTIENCNGGGIFTQGHTCAVTGNLLTNLGDCGITFNGTNAYNCTATGNTVRLCTVQAAFAVETGSYDWTIVGNAINNCAKGLDANDAGYAGGALGGGVFANNTVTDLNNQGGGGSASVGCHIRGAQWRNIRIQGNLFSGITVVGTADSAVYVQTASEGLIVKDNTMEAKAQVWPAAIILSGSAHVRLAIQGNLIRSTSSATKISKGIWFQASGTLTNAIVSDNQFENITNYAVHFDTSVSFTGTLKDNHPLVSASIGAFYQTSPWGTIAAGVVVVPHTLRTQQPGRSVWWASGIPGTGTWAVGDQIWNFSPVAAGVPGWVCTTAGTPGTWKAMAAVAA